MKMGSMYNLESKHANFRDLTQKIIKSAWPEATHQQILFGTNKVYVKLDLLNKMDAVMFEVWKKKNEKAKRIQR